MVRSRLTVAAATAAAVVLWTSGAPAATSLYSWHVPYPFASNASSPGRGVLSLDEPRKSFRARGPMGSSARFIGMRWSGWGTSRAIGRGTGRYCTPSGCQLGRKITITLNRPTRDCLGATSSYTRYRLKNLRPYPSRTLVSGSTPGC